MKITAEIGSYSSVVGSGVLLKDENGNMVGQIAFLCHGEKLRTKEMQERLATVCCDAINGGFNEQAV